MSDVGQITLEEGYQSIMALQIARIKPNPVGKDRNRYGHTNAAHLAAEWLDFRNDGAASVDLNSVELYHRAYHQGQNPTWEKVLAFVGQLGPARMVRVHSGNGPESVLKDEDRQGADCHLFTGKNYVWNNREGDMPALYDRVTEVTLDTASYDPNPPEGEVLVRSGTKLVPTTTLSHSYR